MSPAAREVDGLTVGAAERELGLRIVAVDGATAAGPRHADCARATLTVFGEVAHAATHLAKGDGAPPGLLAGGTRLALAVALASARASPTSYPILVRLAVAAAIVFVLAMWHFHGRVGKSWLDAAYFVMATMTTTGYGDLTPNRGNPGDIAVDMILMLAGITLSGLFIAFGASLLTRVQWVALQGLRPVHRRGHIVVCGAGSIGSEVIDLLLEAGKRVVVDRTRARCRHRRAGARAELRSSDRRRQP